MTTAAFADRWSVITLGADEGPTPWETLFTWPRFGDAHISLGDTTGRNVWAARLDGAVAAARAPVLLVANGAGCQAAAWWARLSPAAYVSRVTGAMFFSPADDDASTDAFASPRIRLPFPSLVVPTNGDAAALAPVAADWGSRVMRGARIRSSALAPADAWRHAQRLLGSVTARVIERDVASVRRLRPVDFDAGRAG